MERYDSIGTGYTRRRREDPRIAQRLWAALGDAQSVVNVGAGAGSYEPLNRHLVAVEPSPVMIAQRPSHRVPGVLGCAEQLPLADQSVDAAMSVLSLHHWHDKQAGLDELLRVARRRIVILTIDPVISGQMWLMAGYLPEVAALDHRTQIPPDDIAGRLGGHVEVVKVPADCRDGFLLAFWAHPEWVLDNDARAATSGFARMPPSVVDRVVSAVDGDLASGTWDMRWGYLRTLSEFDAGLRLVVAEVT